MFHISKEARSGFLTRSGGTFEDFWTASEALFSWWRHSQSIAITPRTMAIMRDGEVVAVSEDGHSIELLRPDLAKGE